MKDKIINAIKRAIHRKATVKAYLMGEITAEELEKENIKLHKINGKIHTRR